MKSNAKYAVIEKYIQAKERGQITIPIEVRKKFDLDNDVWMHMIADDNGIYLKPMNSSVQDPHLRHPQSDIGEFLEKTKNHPPIYSDDPNDYWNTMDDPLTREEIKELQKKYDW